MDPIKNFFRNLGAVIARMTPSQVMMLLGVGAGTIVGTILLVGWFKAVTYAPLYTDLQPDEAGEVVSYLTDRKIPYRLTDGGTTVEVPSDEVYRTRIALASEGLPRSGNIGYSIFDRNNLGMTDFLQNLNFRRALEGELTRTITQLSEVKAARVHIVMPKDRLFTRDRKEATASVVLKLTSPGSLSKRQLAGITHLVAASVEGLKPQNITVVDYDGNLLTGGRDGDELAGLSASQLEVRQQVERYLEQKAQSMLERVLGPGRSIVRVTADLNFQRVERTAETYDPNAPAVRSEERTRTSNNSSDKAQEASESTEQATSETTITNYELNKTVEHIVNAVGTIERLSVAIMVDGTYEEPEGGAGEGELVYQPRSQEELDRLAAIVRNAVGFDPQRNDQLEIVNIAFDRRNLDKEQEALDSMYQREFLFEVGQKVGLFLLALAALFYVRKRVRKLFQTLGALMQTPATVPAATTQSTAAATPEEPLPVVEPEKRRPKLVDQMQRTAEERPDEIAKVIKTMMIE